MDLIGDPWIPVIDGSGETRLVGLRELFSRADKIQDLALRPAKRIAVTRLLLTITYAGIDGPADDYDWEDCRVRIIPAALQHLDDCEDAFQLDGDHSRPFLQVPTLEATDNASLDKLDFTLSSGNNDTLFDHEGSKDGRPQSAAWTALNLLTYQCFSPGGTIGVSNWGGEQTAKNSEHAPAIEASPMHVLVRGQTLLDTIHFNLVPLNRLPEPLGIPVWQADLSTRESATSDLATGVLGRLTPLARAVRLNIEDRKLTLVNGVSYPKLPASRELFTTVVLRKRQKAEEHAYLSIDLAKHPWRELAGILMVNKGQSTGGPLALQHLHSRQTNGIVDFWVGGLVADKGKLIDEAEWTLSVALEDVNETFMSTYTSGVELANRAAGCLKSATKSYADDLSAMAESFRTAAVTRFWSVMDLRYPLLVGTASRNEDLSKWRDFLQRAMHDAYSEACPHNTPRQIQAFVAGRRWLSLKDKANKKKSTKQETTA